MAGKQVIDPGWGYEKQFGYSQAVRAGNLVFLAGQMPVDAQCNVVAEGDIVGQARQVFENLKTVLGAAGLGFDQVVRCGIFVTDLNDFTKVNEVYGRYFKGPPPARATVQVAALPKGARVEIDAIAKKRASAG